MSRFLKFLKQDPENINLLIAISSEYSRLTSKRLINLL